MSERAAPPPAPAPQPQAGARRLHAWRAAWRTYSTPASLRMLALGFAAGLPLPLLMSTLSFRLREAGIDRATISQLSWVGLAYGFKWVWSPLVDRLPLPLLTPWLGQRRSWLLLGQLVGCAALVALALIDPRQALGPLVACALALALASATQDIALDAYRIESAASVEAQAVLSASYQAGYRLALLWATSGALWLASWAQAGAQGYHHHAWQTAYLLMALSMGAGWLTVLISPEPLYARQSQAQAQTQYRQQLDQVAQRGVPWLGLLSAAGWLLALWWLVARAMKLDTALMLDASWQALIGPGAGAETASGWAAWLHGLLRQGPLLLALALALTLSLLAARGHGPRLRPRAGSAAQRALAWGQASFVMPIADFLGRYGRHALLLLLLIGVYRISDIVMGVMANPFYVDMRYTKDEVATVTKFYGLLMTLLGTFIGGALPQRLGIMRTLMLGAALSSLSNLGFAWLAGQPHNMTGLILVVSADNLAGGLAAAAFVGYLSSLTNLSYSATQYALFSSLMLLGPKFLAGFSGQYVNAHGYAAFFTHTAWLGLPVLLLVALAARMQPPAAKAP